MNKKKKGSSETTREAFCFDLYAKYKPEHVKRLKNHFLQWFIGFTEGLGFFQTWKDKGKNKICFTIDQKDPQVLYYIRTELGFGSVQKNKGYYRFFVGDQKNLHRLYCLFAGNIVLNKKHLDFTKWASFIIFPESFSINSDYQKNIENNKICGSNLINLNNAWLSGFFQANGGFLAWSHPSRFNIILKIYISQKNEVQALERIKFLIPTDKEKIFEGISNNSQGIDGHAPVYDRLTFTCSKSLPVLFSYFKKYKLYGEKQINFGRIKRIFDQRSKITNNLLILSEKASRKLQKLIFAIKTEKKTK